MRNLFLIFGLLLGYTLIYTGLSHIWTGVFVVPDVIP